MRVKIEFTEPFCFTTTLAVRIGDINYGGHLGNDKVLSILQEARLQFLQQWGFTELDCGGCGLIMADSAIQYKGEAFYADELHIHLAIANCTNTSFDILYRIIVFRDGVEKPIALAKTAMLCFDYPSRKIIPMPDLLRQKLKP